uniref:sn-1-specific diacylglycerol lipase n=1 Tax=Meloidogyne hapla TaxID=6305 RepID=A0A1I8B8G2_MELHA
MPPLQAFGHHWNISSDDFVFPGLTDLIVRSLCVLVGNRTRVICSLVIFIVHNPFGCSTFVWLPIVSLMIFLNVLSGGLSFALAMLSAQGSIMEMEKRRHVSTLLYARLPVFFVEVIWTITTTLLSFNIFYNADNLCKIESGIRIAVVIEWILVISIFIGAICVFNPHEGRRMDRSLVDERLYWKRNFFLCKMRADSQVRQALDDIAMLISQFFEDNNYVISDIIAGLLLLVHSPHKRIPPPIESIIKTENELPHWMKLPNCLKYASRYFEFAFAVYGWPHYIACNCACGAWYLLCKKLNCCCRSHANRRNFTLMGDNCCSCHSSALELMLDDECTLAFVCFRNGLFEVPFAVVIDHHTNAIVIAIRGSASFMDIITDLSLDDEMLDSIDVDSDPILRSDKELDGYGEIRVHRGILKSARYIYETLQANHIIEDAQQRYPNYHIMICGHSLGAGIGSLLALFLKIKCPDIRCYAFAPPGSVISENGIYVTEKSTLSFVLGDDVVPRMTFQSISLLKTEVERELTTTDKAKYEILIKGIFKLIVSYPFSLHRVDNISTQGFANLTENFTDLRHSESIGTREERIMLTSSMLSDHLPYNIHKALLIAKEY